MASATHNEAVVTVDLLDCMQCHVQLTRLDVTLKDERDATTLAIVNTPTAASARESQVLLGLDSTETVGHAQK